MAESNRSSSRPSRSEKKKVLRAAQITDTNQIRGRADSDGEYGLAGAVTQSETENDAAQGPAIPAELRTDAPCPALSLRSSLLSDLEWVADFARITNDLIDAVLDLYHDGLPSYRRSVIDRRWRPALERLAAHLKAAQDAPNVSPSSPCAIDPNVEEAFHLATAVLEDVADPAGPTGSIDVVLLRIADLLVRSRADSPADSPLPVALYRPSTADRPAAGPGAPLAIDYKALTTELRKGRKPTQAALVEFMEDKSEASAEDVARHVHGDSGTSDGAMWNNAKRASDSLAAMGARLSFRFASGRMFRDIAPE